MVHVWRVVPALTSALMVVVLGVFGLIIVDASERRTADQLGFSGETVGVVAIPADDFGGPEPLTAALVGFAEKRDVSVAYSRSHGTGLVTVLDEDGRFRIGDGSLGAALGPAGSTAALSTAVGDSGSGIPELELPEGVTAVGTFDPDVKFQRYPVVVFNVGARPFAEGVYLFAGDGLGSDGSPLVRELVRIFDTHGMAVVELTPRGGTTTDLLLAETLATPYGVVVLLFTGIVVLTQVLVLVIYSAIFRDRLVVAAVVGAGRRHLRGMVWGRLLRQVLPGAVAGAGISAGVVLGTAGLALAGTGTRVLVVAAALAVSILVSALICGAVAWREAGRVARVVPC